MKRKQRDNPAVPETRRSIAIWLAFALAFVTFLAYARVPAHGFTWWDDHQTLHRNPDFTPPTLAGIARYWSEPEAGLYIPVTYTIWGLLALVAHGNRIDPIGSALNASVFHFASVIVHIGSALLVMALLRRLLKDADDGDRKDWAAFAGAMLYAVHPVQVEPVAWASGMKDLLFGFFSLLALWQYAKWAQGTREAVRGPDIPLPYAVALVAAALGMLSKPTAVVIPVAAFVIDYWMIGRPLRRVVRSVAPLVAMAVITAVVARAAQPASHVQAAPLWARPLIVGDALAFYLYKLVFPAWLAVDYGRRPSAVLSNGWAYVAWIIPAVLLLGAWFVRRTAPHLLVGAMLFAIGALPVLGFLPFEFQGYSTVSDHYLYLSMLGPALAMAWAVQRLGSRRHVAVACVVVVVLALFWLRTMLQTRHWRDDEALWTHNLEVNPRSFLAYTNLGFWNDFRRRPARAIEMYRQAVRLNDEYVNATAMYNLANGLLRSGEYEQAVAWYRKLIDVSMTVPHEARVAAPLDAAYVNMGRALAKLERKEEAAEAFRKAREVNPEQKAAAEALKNL
jgi:hypothetical protein